MAQERKYAVSEMEADCGGAIIRGAQASFVAPPTLDYREKRVKQFQRALRILKLQPYAHPSQLNETVSAHGGEGDQEPRTGDTIVDVKQEEKRKGNAFVQIDIVFGLSLTPSSSREDGVASAHDARQDRIRLVSLIASMALLWSLTTGIQAVTLRLQLFLTGLLTFSLREIVAFSCC